MSTPQAVPGLGKRDLHSTIVCVYINVPKLIQTKPVMTFIVIAVVLTAALVLVGVAAHSVLSRNSGGYSALDTGGGFISSTLRVHLLSGVLLVASGLILAATLVQHHDTKKLREDFDDSDIGGLTRDVANLSSMLLSNLAQDSVDKSILTTHGTQLTALQGTCYVCNNLIENPVYACWDTNEDGLCTLPGEDKNNDGNCTASDCHGLDGHACWDLDADRVCDLVTEDKNNDGQCTAEDCVGAPGTHGTNGTSGAQGFHCWDLNENRACDLGTEDINLDGNCTVADCTHYANGSIELVNAAGAYIDFKLLEDTDYDVRLQHVQHGFHLTTGGSGSAQLGMVLDANGRVGLGTRTPSYDVHIVDDTVGYNQIRIHSNHTSGRAGISLYQNTATSDFVMQHSTSGAGFLHNRGGNLTIMANSLHFFSNDAPVTEAIHVTSTGSIGFGTKHSGVYPYKFGGSVYAPTLVSSICTTSTVSSQTSGLALQSGATPGAGAEITMFGDGVQGNSAFYDSAQHKFRGLNGAIGTGEIEIYGNDESLRLVGVDHVYAALYKDGAAGGRSAWIGYGGAGQTALKINNQVSGGSFEVNTNGGDITLGSPTAVYGGLAVHSDSFPQLLIAIQSDPTKTFSLNVNSGGTATWRPSSGTLLITDGTGAGYLTTSVDASGDVTWTPSGGDITVNGKTTLSAGTTEQLRLQYSTSKYATFTVDTNGYLNVAPSHGRTIFSGSVDSDYLLRTVNTHADGYGGVFQSKWRQLTIVYDPDPTKYTILEATDSGGIIIAPVGLETNINGRLTAAGTASEQLRLMYSASAYVTMRVDDGGRFVLRNEGSDNYFKVENTGAAFAAYIENQAPTRYGLLVASKDRPQLRLVYAPGPGDIWGTANTEFETTANGNLVLRPNGGVVTISASVSDVQLRIANDATTYTIKVRDVGTDDDRFIIADESANAERFVMDATGDITTTGAVNHVSTHPLPNGGSSRWIKLGTLSNMDQHGRSATIHIVSNTGYHPDVLQDFEVFVRFKTYNSPASGATFSLNYHSVGADGHFGSVHGARIKVHNTTYNTFDFYVFTSTFSGEGAFYTVQHNYAPARWTHSGADTTPPANALAAQMWWAMQSTAEFHYYAKFNHPVGFGTAAVDAFRVTVNGRATIGDAYEPAAYGHVQIVRPPSQGSLFHQAFVREGNQVMGMGFLDNSNTFGMQVASDNLGSNGIFMKAGQLIGIHKRDPTAALDVVGNIEVTGTVDGFDVSTLQAGDWTHSVSCSLGCSNVINSALTYIRIGSTYHVAGQLVFDSEVTSDYEIDFTGLPVTTTSCMGTVSGYGTGTPIPTQVAAGRLSCSGTTMKLRVGISDDTAGYAYYLSLSGIVKT